MQQLALNMSDLDDTVSPLAHARAEAASSEAEGKENQGEATAVACEARSAEDAAAFEVEAVQLPTHVRSRVLQALTRLAIVQNQLGDHRAQGAAERRIERVLEQAQALPDLDVIDSACACVALIPVDEAELHTRPRVYTAVVDLLMDALSLRWATTPIPFAQLQELLADRPLLDAVEEVLAAANGAARLRNAMDATAKHLVPVMRRVALRASTLVERAPEARCVPASAHDLASIRLTEARYSTWHAPTGLLGTATTLHPAEIRRYVPILLADAMQGDAGALICLVSFFVAKMPRYFSLVGVGAGSPLTLFVSEDFSLVTWRGRTLHRSAPLPSAESHLATTDQVSTPLPVEVAELLRSKRGTKQAMTLADVCAEDEDLTRLASAYLGKFSHGPRSVTLERLANTLPRLVGQCASDKVIGAAAYCDFGLVNKAKMHYAIIRAALVNAACREAFAATSLSGSLAAELSSDAAINPHLNDAAIAKAVAQLSQAIETASRLCGSLASWQRLRQVHRTLCVRVAALLQLLTGVRPTKKFRIAMRSLDLQAGILLVTDKRSSRYETRRLIALPRIVIEALQYYMVWLERLSKSSKVPLAVRRSIAARVDKEGCASFFFLLEEQRLTPLRGKHVAGVLRMTGVDRANEGRRVVERLAREGGASRAAVDSQLGHTPAGAETYCRASALRPVDILPQIQRAMDRRLSELNVGTLLQASALATASTRRAFA